VHIIWGRRLQKNPSTKKIGEKIGEPDELKKKQLESQGGETYVKKGLHERKKPIDSGDRGYKRKKGGRLGTRKKSKRDIGTKQKGGDPPIKHCQKRKGKKSVVTGVGL